jgi:hypothetical protein
MSSITPHDKQSLEVFAEMWKIRKIRLKVPTRLTAGVLPNPSPKLNNAGALSGSGPATSDEPGATDDR